MPSGGFSRSATHSPEPRAGTVPTETISARSGWSWRDQQLEPEGRQVHCPRFSVTSCCCFSENSSRLKIPASQRRGLDLQSSLLHVGGRGRRPLRDVERLLSPDVGRLLPSSLDAFLRVRRRIVDVPAERERREWPSERRFGLLHGRLERPAKVEPARGAVAFFPPSLRPS